MLRCVLETVPVGIVTIDGHGTVLAFNPAAERLFGYRADEVIGRNVNVLMPEPYRSRHDDYLRRYLATGEARIIGKGREVVGIRKDGREVNIELTVWANAADPGQSFTGLMRDVTERVQTEKRLREAAAELSTALELARAGHWELDLDTDLFTFNDEFYKILGTTAAQIGGYRLPARDYAARFVHPDDAAIVREEIGRALASTDAVYVRDIEHRFQDAEGRFGYLAVGMRGARDERVRMDPTQHMGALYPFSLADKLAVITENSPWYADAGASPWGRPIIPLEMISVLAQYTSREAAFPVKGPAVGLFADLEIRLIDGPLFVGEDYLIRREVVALAESRRTESLWIRTDILDASGQRLLAQTLLNSATLKHSYAGYEAERAAKA